jgi:ATP-dependent helicase HrpA
VVSVRHFDAWWKKARQATPELLTLTPDDLVRPGAGAVSAEQFPDRWTSGEFTAELAYRFDPGADTDGLIVRIPLPALATASGAGLGWQVPGRRAELVTALLRTLPKQLRREIVPIPDTAAALVAVLGDDLGPHPLTAVLSAGLRRRGVQVPADAWRPDQLPDYLRPTYQVLDADGSVLGQSKDLAELQTRFAPRVTATLQSVTADIARDRVPDWDFEELPRVVRREAAGLVLTGYPALVDTGDSVAVRVLDSEPAQRQAHWAGTRRLLLNTLPSPVKSLIRGLGPQSRLTLGQAPHGSPAALLADCVAAAVDAGLRRAGGPVWRRADFQRLRGQVAENYAGDAAQLLTVVEQIVTLGQQVELGLTELTTPPLRPVAAEIRQQLDSLIHPGFVLDTGTEQLRQLPRYLRALRQRITDAQTNPARDRERQAQVQVLLADLAELTGSVGNQPELARIRWLIEEFRVSVFAQQLGTAQPVSIRRIQAAMDEIEDQLRPA